MGKEAKKTMRVFVVYSALHTGTWFTVGAIKHGRTMSHVADKFFVERYGCTIEHYPTSKFLNLKFQEEVIEFATEYMKCKPSEIKDGYVLQAHNRSQDSNLLYCIQNSKPFTPVVIPMRDPLLSINTRIWRECRTVDTFRLKDEGYRMRLAKDQIMSIKNLLLRVPRRNVCVIPVDLCAEDKDRRRSSIESLWKHCDLDIPDDADRFIQSWGLANDTVFWHTQREDTYADNDFFEEMKSRIMSNDVKFVESNYRIEIAALRDEGDLRQSLVDLGYDPCW